MKMPIKVTYYKKKSCAQYIAEVFETYEDFGKWYLVHRLDIGILSIIEIEKSDIDEDAGKIRIGKMKFDSFW